MPDLGLYAVEVLAAYAISIALLAVIVLLSVRRSRLVRKRLEAVDALRKTPDV